MTNPTGLLQESNEQDKKGVSFMSILHNPHDMGDISDSHYGWKVFTTMFINTKCVTAIGYPVSDHSARDTCWQRTYHAFQRSVFPADRTNTLRVSAFTPLYVIGRGLFLLYPATSRHVVQWGETPVSFFRTLPSPFLSRSFPQDCRPWQLRWFAFHFPVQSYQNLFAWAKKSEKRGQK